MFDVQRHSLMAIIITIIGSLRNKIYITFSNSNLRRKGVVLDSQELLSKAVLPPWNWCKSPALTHSFCSTPRSCRGGKIFFLSHIPSPALFPLCFMGSAQKVQKIGWEIQLRVLLERRAPQLLQCQHSPVPTSSFPPYTGQNEVMMLTVQLILGWDSSASKDCSL